MPKLTFTAAKIRKIFLISKIMGKIFGKLKKIRYLCTRKQGTNDNSDPICKS